MSLEKAIKITGIRNKETAKSALNNLTIHAPLKMKVALKTIINN